jgi:hypothetical protein
MFIFWKIGFACPDSGQWRNDACVVIGLIAMRLFENSCAAVSN